MPPSGPNAGVGSDGSRECPGSDIPPAGPPTGENMLRSEDFSSENRLKAGAPALPPFLRAAKPVGANPGVSGNEPLATCESGVEMVRPRLLRRLRGCCRGTMNDGEEGSEKARSSGGGALLELALDKGRLTSPLVPAPDNFDILLSGLTSDAVVAGRVLMPRVLMDRLRTLRKRFPAGSLPSEPGGGEMRACSLLIGDSTVVSVVLPSKEFIGRESVGDSGDELGDEPVSAESRVEMVEVGEDPADADCCVVEPRRDRGGVVLTSRLNWAAGCCPRGVGSPTMGASLAPKSVTAETDASADAESACKLDAGDNAGMFFEVRGDAGGRVSRMTERLRKAATVGTFRRTVLRGRSLIAMVEGDLGETSLAAMTYCDSGQRGATAILPGDSRGGDQAAAIMTATTTAHMVQGAERVEMPCSGQTLFK